MASRRAHELAAAALGALSVAAALSLGRVFDSGRFVAPVIGAALLPHAIGLLTRRRRRPVWAVVALSGAGAFLYAVWAVEGSTTAYGVPTPDTLDALATHLDDGYHALRTAVVPAPVSDGALVLSVLTVWAVATVADLLAFHRDATVGAAAPALGLFVWAATLGTTELRARTTLGFAAAAMVFLLLQHQALLERRRGRFAGRRLGTGTGLVGLGVRAGIVAVVAGVVVGPALPGAGSDALIDVRGLGGDDGNPSYQTEPPLARIAGNFAVSEPVELFEVESDRREYWRIAALDRYTSADGGQWTLTAEGDDEVGRGLDEPASGAVLSQEFRISALDGRWMPAAYRPVRVEGGDALVVRDSTTLVTGRESVRGLRYVVRSEIPTTPDAATEAARRATARSVPAELRPFTSLPVDFPGRVRTLALELVAGAETPLDEARALERFFLDPSSGFEYSLDADVGLGPGAQTQSAIEQFVLNRRRGFCVQFAGSYAAMARAVGLPARVAVGFTPGARVDTEPGVYRVTTYEAHAWPEVWLRGLGWARFEPTPPSAELPGGSDLPGRPSPPGEEPADGDDTIPTTSPPGTAPGAGAPPTIIARPGTDVRIDAPTAPAPDRGRGRLLTFSSTVLLAIVAAVTVLAVSAAVTIVAVKARRRATRRARRDPAAAVAGAWEEAVDRLGEAGVAARPALTPLELAASARRRVPEAAATPLGSLAETYTASRYGPTAPEQAVAIGAWTRVDEFRHALGGDVRLRERLRRALDPTALRVRR